MSHTHHDAGYWTRRHTESVLLDIGGDVGALVLYTRPDLHSKEIEVKPLGSAAARIHSAVLERNFNGRTVYAATYPELPAGAYEVCCDAGTRFAISAGRVTELRIE